MWWMRDRLGLSQDLIDLLMHEHIGVMGGMLTVSRPQFFTRRPQEAAPVYSEARRPM